jgi:hypothetical protein
MILVSRVDGHEHEELEHGYEALSDGITKYFPSHIVFHVMLVRISIHLERNFLFGFCL